MYILKKYIFYLSAKYILLIILFIIWNLKRRYLSNTCCQVTRQVSDDIVRASDRTEDVVVSTADVGNKFKFFETYKEPEKERKAFRITPPREGQAKVKTAKPALHRCVLCLANMSSASELSVNTSCSGYTNVLRCRTNCTLCQTALRHPVDTTRPRLSVWFSPRVSLYRIFNIKYRIFNDCEIFYVVENRLVLDETKNIFINCSNSLCDP